MIDTYFNIDKNTIHLLIIKGIVKVIVYGFLFNPDDLEDVTCRNLLSIDSWSDQTNPSTNISPQIQNGDTEPNPK